jgi:hypothetical protein
MSPTTTSDEPRWRLIESLVASMYRMKGSTVQRNARLPRVGSHGHRSRPREIDVLVTGEVAGLPVRVAIECKDEKHKIGSPYIDSFVGKLKDVGIPTQYGIYVSSSGYTDDAIGRCLDAGIRPLLIESDKGSGIAALRSEATYPLVYLFLEVTSMSAVNTIVKTAAPHEILGFRDETGELRATIPDLVWLKWMTEFGSPKLGDHSVQLDVPPNWTHQADGLSFKSLSVEADVRVSGLVVPIPGRRLRAQLSHAQSAQVERSHADWHFAPGDGVNPVTMVNTEEALLALHSEWNPDGLPIVRIKLPRIGCGLVYWPPSERAVRHLTRLRRAADAGDGQDLQSLTRAAVEGTDLSAVFEPIWPGHPSFRTLLQRLQVGSMH